MCNSKTYDFGCEIGRLRCFGKKNKYFKCSGQILLAFFFKKATIKWGNISATFPILVLKFSFKIFTVPGHPSGPSEHVGCGHARQLQSEFLQSDLGAQTSWVIKEAFCGRMVRPVTPPKFNSSPLKSYRAPIVKDHDPTTIFQGRAVKLWGCKPANCDECKGGRTEPS